MPRVVLSLERIGPGVLWIIFASSLCLSLSSSLGLPFNYSFSSLALLDVVAYRFFSSTQFQSQTKLTEWKRRQRKDPNMLRTECNKHVPLDFSFVPLVSRRTMRTPHASIIQCGVSYNYVWRVPNGLARCRSQIDSRAPSCAFRRRRIKVFIVQSKHTRISAKNERTKVKQIQTNENKRFGKYWIAYYLAFVPFLRVFSFVTFRVRLKIICLRWQQPRKCVIICLVRLIKTQ